MLFGQIAPFVFEYKMYFPDMTGDSVYPLREQLRCDGYFILWRDCLFISSLSVAFMEVLGNSKREIEWKTKNPTADGKLSFNGFQLCQEILK